MPINQIVELINKKKFAKVVLHKSIEAFLVDMPSHTSKMTIHLAYKAQIALLIIEKFTVLAEYHDFTNVFTKKFAKMLLEWAGINKHAIKLENSKQPLYGPIYSLSLVELKTLKIYIKINLANGLI